MKIDIDVNNSMAEIEKRISSGESLEHIQEDLKKKREEFKKNQDHQTENTESN